MKFLILVGILSILGIQSSYANIQNAAPETVSAPASEPEQAVRKRAPSTPNDRIARACLSTAAELQEAYLKANGQYATNLEDLKWGNDECFKNFTLTISGDQKAYLIKVKNKKVAWQID